MRSGNETTSLLVFMGQRSDCSTWPRSLDKSFPRASARNIDVGLAYAKFCVACLLKGQLYTGSQNVFKTCDLRV